MVPQISRAEAARRAGPHLAPALQAVLDAEQRLTRIANLRDNVQRDVDRLDQHLNGVERRRQDGPLEAAPERNDPPGEAIWHVWKAAARHTGGL
jgi:hypothetical protein